MADNDSDDRDYDYDQAPTSSYQPQASDSQPPNGSEGGSTTHGQAAPTQPTSLDYSDSDTSFLPQSGDDPDETAAPPTTYGVPAADPLGPTTQDALVDPTSNPADGTTFPDYTQDYESDYNTGEAQPPPTSYGVPLGDPLGSGSPTGSQDYPESDYNTGESQPPPTSYGVPLGDPIGTSNPTGSQDYPEPNGSQDYPEPTKATSTSSSSNHQIPDDYVVDATNDDYDYEDYSNFVQPGVGSSYVPQVEKQDKQNREGFSTSFIDLLTSPQ